MLTKYQKYMENSLKNMIKAMIEDQVSFSIIVGSADNWEKPLPKNRPPSFMINLSGWSLEESYVHDDMSGIFVKTAFGETENSKAVKFSEISTVLDDKGSPLFIRVFEAEESKEYSFKELLHK